MSHASVEQRSATSFARRSGRSSLAPASTAAAENSTPTAAAISSRCTIGRGELVELLFDELADAVGDPEAVEPFLAAHLAADVSQQSAVDQVVDHGRHEQGVAVGVLVDVGDQRL